MIGIRIDDEFADVPADVKVQVFLNNPFITDDVTVSKGSGSLPFNLPGEESSPKNAALLGNPDVLENPEGFRKLDAILHVDGVQYKKGKLIVREAQGGRISTNFNFGLGTISEEIKTKKIRELIADEIVIDSANHPKKVYLKAGALAATPYSITVNGRRYENATLSGLASDINSDLAEPRASASYITTGTTPLGVAQPFIEISAFTNPNDPLSPLHVDYDEDNGNSASGYVWYVEAMSLTSYASAFSTFMDDYNTSPYPTEAIRFPIVFNDSFAGQGGLQNFYSGFDDVGGSIKSNNYVNARNSFGLIFNVPNYSGNGFVCLNRNSIQPFVRVKYVLDKIAEYFNFEWEGDWFDSDANAMLLDHSVSLDVPLDYIGKKKFIFWRRSFNLSELVEDITVSDFLKALQTRYNLGIYLNEITGKVRMIKRENVALQYSDKDITAMSGVIKNRVDQRLTGVRMVSAKDDTDEYSTADEYLIGTPEVTYETRWGALQNEFTTTIGGDTGSVIGIYKRQNFSDKIKHRIFYYKGLIDNGNFIYPQGRKDALNYLEAWSGTGGLYDKLWKYWVYYAMRRRSITMPVAFEFSDLMQIDWEELLRMCKI